MPSLSKERELSNPKPSVGFPDGIGPPRKTVTGMKLENGKPVYTFSYYVTNVPASAIHSNGNDANLAIAKATCPEIQVSSHDVIDYDKYVKEQEGVIAREIELRDTMLAIGEQNNKWDELFTELFETSARRNIPSKDWIPFQRMYRLPNYRTRAQIGAPAIQANLPY